MLDKTFYYRKLSWAARLGIAFLITLGIPLFLLLINHVMRLDLSLNDILIFTAFFGVMSLLLISLPKSHTNHRYTFACRVTNRGMQLPTNAFLTWDNIINIHYITESEIIVTKHGKEILYYHFMDIYVNNHTQSVIRVSLDKIEHYQPNEVFDEVNYHWQRILHNKIPPTNINLPYVVRYNTVKKGTEGFYVFLALFIIMVMSYFSTLGDNLNLATATIILILLCMGLLSHASYLLTRMDSIALYVSEQGIQNEGLIAVNKTIFWEDIQSITIKRTVFGGHITINLYDNNIYLDPISVRRKIAAWVYKKIGLTYFCVRSDLKEASFINTYRVLTEEWQKHTGQTIQLYEEFS